MSVAILSSVSFASESSTVTMMSTNDDQTPECPLCLEQLEMDDINFFPCTCGYQICRFCWHRIRTDENGLCPACRKQYPEDPANFKPLTAEEMQRIKNEKRQKDLQRKQKISENRKHLANVRVVQKNLVFVVGLPSRLADPEALKKHDYFGKFGKIVKVIVNHSTSYAGSQGPSASAYVTYQKAEDALKAIQAVNNSKVDGRTLKASLGTTKYCSNFLKKQQCPKPDCMYLHELGDEAASFTKEEMQLGKHQEYEHKLYEQMVHNNNLNRKQLSPAEHIDTSQFVQKERWPSPSKKEDHRINGIPESEGYSQSVQNNSKTTTDSSTFKSKHNSDATAGCPEERLSERETQQLLKSQFRRNNIIREEYPNSDVEHQNVNCLPSETSRHLPLMNSSFNCSSNSGFKNVNFVSNAHKSQTQSFENTATSEKSDLIRQKSQQNTSSAELVKGPFPLQQSRPKSPVSHAVSLPNGMSLGSNSVVLNNLQMSQEWVNAHPREYYKHKIEMPPNSSSDPVAYTLNHHEDNSNNSVFSAGRNTLYDVQHFQYPTLSSVHEDSNQTCYPLCSSIDNRVNNSDSTGENSVHEEQDDELDFDPWHESSKGLADLMIKEAGEKARVNYPFVHRPSMNSYRRSMMLEPVSVQNRCMENSHSGPRPIVPPPGFHINNYGANTSMPRPSFGADAYSSKILPVMNAYNHSPTSAPMTQYQQQVLHPSVGLANNVLHMPEAGMRPHPREWQENITNLPQSTVDHSFGPLVQQQQQQQQQHQQQQQQQQQHQQQQHMPVLGRASHPSWNNSVPTDIHWLSQGQAPLNQGYIENRANSPSHILKMLQQLKMKEYSVRIQNQQNYAIPSIPSYSRDFSFSQ